MTPLLSRLAFAGLALVTFLAPIKFSNPVIFYHLDVPPQNLAEWIWGGWPNPLLFWGMFILGFLLVLRRDPAGNRKMDWPWILPVFFLLTQVIASYGNLRWDLMRPTLLFFTCLVIAYRLGALFLRSEEDLKWILLAWVAAIFYVSWEGIDQARGGLEQTRVFFMQNPSWMQLYPDLWAKLQSNRIFSTLAYPNALGGFLISGVFLLLAAAVMFRRQARWGMSMDSWRALVGGTTVFLMGAMLYCLVKSQSKGALVVLLVTALVAAWLLMKDRKRLGWLMGGILAGVMTIFVVGYGMAALEKAQRTGSARLGYWKAAWKIGLEHPLRGTGPGTFASVYPFYKQPQDEDTRLVHNNYLQMWSDSGLPGFVAFLGFLPGSLFLWWKRWGGRPPSERRVPTLVFCACLGFALHSLMDFDLYLPSNAMPIFILLGYLAGSGKKE